MKLRTITVAALVAAAALLPALPGRSAFPGNNRRVVFSQFANNTYDLFTVSSDGSDPRRLTDTRRFETDPAFSPDGRWIAFSAFVQNNFVIFKSRQN